MLNPAEETFRQELARAVPSEVFRPEAETYFEEPRGRFHGRRGPVLAPRDAEEAAAIVRACNAARVGVVPYGGGTGLVAGQLLTEGPAPVILSLERMTAIREVSGGESVLVAEAGVTLQAARAVAEEAGLLLPLSLASEGSCRVGGMLATNAGGVNTLRYGNARALCLGLEAVLPTGEVWHGLTPLRKDNLGYDLRDLLIGAEGTLGIITAASLRLAPRPAHQLAMLLAVPGPEAALDLLNLLRSELGETVSAYELMHRQGFDFIAETLPGTETPFGEPPDWTVLADIGAPGAMALADTVEPLLGKAAERGLVLDGWIAQSEAQRQAFWALRETIPEANRRIGAISSHDISVPIAAIPEFIARAGPKLSRLGGFRINCFGHAGDGNLHYNVFPEKGRRREDYDPLRHDVKRVVHDLVHELGGSVAAEHGVGRLKVDDLERYADPAKRAAMRAIKGALDPNGIMNPGAVLRGA